MAKYDAIVIGAGNGGLIAALRLLKRGKKVLILEKNNIPGGYATSFIRGRFEFEVSLHSFCDFGSKENPGVVYKLFRDLELLDKIRFNEVDSAYHVYFKDTKEDYKLPFGIDHFIASLEQYVPNSEGSVTQFFAIALECKEALHYIEKHEHPNEQVIKEDYPNFFSLANASLTDGLNSLKIPLKAQQIITAYWTSFGSPASTLSFVSFASKFYSFISLGVQIPKKTSYEISLTLAEEIEKNGGEIKYLSTAKEILFDHGKMIGVKLTNDEEYYANHIISNISPNLLYGAMIPEKYLPKKAKQLTNSRILGAKGFSIYLGLNQSAKDIGLKDYNYFIYQNSDSDKEYAFMNKIENNSTIVSVINNANPSASPKGTCIMHFTSFFYGNVFTNSVTEENYFRLKERIARRILANFEETTGLLLKPYIEEIEIASPVTFARYGGHPDGVIYGYKATGADNFLSRILNYSNENYIKNLQFCGGFASFLSGFHSTYLSGNYAALKTLKAMEEGENHE